MVFFWETGEGKRKKIQLLNLPIYRFPSLSLLPNNLFQIRFFHHGKPDLVQLLSHTNQSFLRRFVGGSGIAEVGADFLEIVGKFPQIALKPGEIRLNLFGALLDLKALEAYKIVFK
jgi:hypothetical protein